MDLELNGRTALVTGASSGLGRAIALGLAAEGVRVVGVGRREAELHTMAEVARRLGGEPVIIVQDLLAADAVERIVAATLAAVGHVDILVNNAGGSVPVDFATPDQDWVDRMTLNFLRARELAHALLPAMRSAGWGRILNVTGIGEPRGLNATLPAKEALRSWAKGLSREVGRDGVTVNCLAPGRIHSDQVARDWTEPQIRAFADAEIPIGRFGDAAEFADVAVFLASERASYVTGATVFVDGGMSRA